MANSKLGIALTLKPNAPSQYAGFDFISMCKCKGVCLGFNEDGMFTLFDADGDDWVDSTHYTSISAYFKTALTDFGNSFQKRWRRLFVGCESDGDISATYQMDEGTEQTVTASPTQVSSLQTGVEINGRRDQKGRYTSVKISNVSGSRFSIDMIDGFMNILNRKPSGS